jgi:hypothetical protein
MTYYNLVVRLGHERCAHSLRDAGVDGIIVADLRSTSSTGGATRPTPPVSRTCSSRADDPRRPARRDLRAHAVSYTASRSWASPASGPRWRRTPK